MRSREILGGGIEWRCDPLCPRMRLADTLGKIERLKAFGVIRASNVLRSHSFSKDASAVRCSALRGPTRLPTAPESCISTHCAALGACGASESGEAADNGLTEVALCKVPILQRSESRVSDLLLRGFLWECVLSPQD